MLREREVGHGALVDSYYCELEKQFYLSQQKEGDETNKVCCKIFTSLMKHNTKKCKRKMVLVLLDNIWDVNLADIQLDSKYNKAFYKAQA